MSSPTPKCFNVDFNWDFAGRPASPGLFTFADPLAHADFYEELGANIAMLNTVAFNGWAWYPSEIVPVTPGPGRDFTPLLAEELSRRNIQSIGYMTLGWNPDWDIKHPECAHTEVPLCTWKGVLTESYVDYCAAHIAETLDRVQVDGVFVDWIHAPARGTFLEVEKQEYRTLMGEDWPALGVPPPEVIAEFDRRLLNRAWERISASARSVRDCILFTNHPFEEPNDPFWEGSPILKDADWILNEAPGTEMLDWITSQSKPGAVVFQNIVGWVSHDTEKVMAGLGATKYGLFGFAQADPVTTLVAETGCKGAEANARNMEAVRAAFART